MTDQTTDQQHDQPTPLARIVSDKVRERVVSLEYPVEFNGVLYRQIRVKRATAAEVRAYIDKVTTGDQFVLPPVIECPIEVWEALDADDQLTVDEIAMEFMPKRLKVAAPPAAAGDQQQ